MALDFGEYVMAFVTLDLMFAVSSSVHLSFLGHILIMNVLALLGV